MDILQFTISTTHDIVDLVGGMATKLRETGGEVIERTGETTENIVARAPAAIYSESKKATLFATNLLRNTGKKLRTENAELIADTKQLRDEIGKWTADSKNWLKKKKAIAQCQLVKKRYNSKALDGAVNKLVESIREGKISPDEALKLITDEEKKAVKQNNAELSIPKKQESSVPAPVDASLGA